MYNSVIKEGFICTNNDFDQLKSGQYLAQPKEKNTKLIQLDSWTEPFWNVNDCSIFNSIKIQQLPSSNDNSDKIELFNLFLQEIQIKDYY